MARIGIEETQVIEIADELARSGRSPTVSEVREKLGTGSFATISRYLKTWRERQLGQSEFPAPPAPVATALNQVWASAWRAAESGFETEKTAFTREKQEWASEKDQLLAEIERLETERSRQDQSIQQSDGRLAEAQATIERQRTALEEAGREQIRLEAHLRAAEENFREAALRADRMERELTRMADDHQAAGSKWATVPSRKRGEILIVAR